MLGANLVAYRVAVPRTSWIGLRHYGKGGTAGMITWNVGSAWLEYVYAYNSTSLIQHL